MHPAHTRHARRGTHVHSAVRLVVLQRHQRVGGGHVVLAAAQCGHDGVGEVAPGGLLVGVLYVHVRIGYVAEAVLARRRLESCYEAGGRLVGSYLGRVLGWGLVWELRVLDDGVGVHVGVEGGFDVFGGVVCVECAHVGLHLCLLSVGVIVCACGIRHLVLRV